LFEIVSVLFAFLPPAVLEVFGVANVREFDANDATDAVEGIDDGRRQEDFMLAYTAGPLPNPKHPLTRRQHATEEVGLQQRQLRGPGGDGRRGASACQS
jgi:hypothetical protein